MGKHVPMLQSMDVHIVPMITPKMHPPVVSSFHCLGTHRPTAYGEQKECSEFFSCVQVEVRARVSDQFLEDACRFGCSGMDMCISTCT